MKVDVIMLAKGSDRRLRQMTQKAINSILSSSRAVEFHIVVVETMEGVEYKGCTMVHPKRKFNYNEFTRLGLDHSKGYPYTLFVNNDILAYKGFAERLIDGLDVYASVSPVNPRIIEHKKLATEYNEGFSIWSPARFCGWAFMMKRETIDELQAARLFPLELEGWYSDNWVCDLLQHHGLQHALVRSSKLDHLQSVTIKSLDRSSHDHYTSGQKRNYDDLLGSLE